MYFLQNLIKNFQFQSYLNPNGGVSEKLTFEGTQKQAIALKSYETQDWFQKLGPEEQEKYADLHKQKEGITAGLKFVSNHGKKLSSGLSKIAETEDPNDPEFQEFKQQINARLQSLGKEYTTLQGKGADVTAQLDKIANLQKTLQGDLDNLVVENQEWEKSNLL